MLARALRTSMRPLAAAAARRAPMAPVRALAIESDGLIPDIEDQVFGRRKMELDAEKSGDLLFNRDPIVPPVGAGTKENPILVPSEFKERVVGFEDPDTHQIAWFCLQADATYYIESVDKYFKLHTIENPPVVTVDHH
uniref:Uncharacterized protein n=1 Tax=Phaeomonas parva TaxID=124430 RepID=A0A7S1XX62_9STRA|mmetsp:Transcript_5667/g.15844  ORF Transcript_5667/g.15844 Transcript_5667/m.15844 type:complete len:138 (+) Transcript_5667:40-453(+)